MHFKKYFFSYILSSLLIFTVIVSCYRFIIISDYIVSYEIDCDPTTESCFVGCEDDECTQEYYYAVMERKAFEINSICGKDIINCDMAYYCPNDTNIECNLTYCNAETDGDSCSDLNNI